MLIAITGQPGNGKTLRCLHEAETEYNRNAAAVAEGKEEPRQFFTNVVGATYPENPDAFPWMQPMPEHRDWTQLPDGSYVIYDEAHADGNTQGLEHYGKLFPATGRPGESDDPRIRAMSTHRHRGFDIVVVTQYPSKLHHNLRQLVGKHIHMNRAMGLQAAGVLIWSRMQADPYDERQREKAEEEIWRYPKHLFGKYRSAVLHTSSYKFRIPGKLLGFLSSLVMMCVLAVAAWVYFSNKAEAAAAKTGQGAAIGQAPSGAAGPLPRSVDPPSSVYGTVPISAQAAAQSSPPVPSGPPEPAACMVGKNGCSCWGRDGRKIPQDQPLCLAMLDGFPLDMRPSATFAATPVPPAPAAPSAGVGAAHGDAFTSAIQTPGQIGAYGDLGIKPNPGPRAENPGWGTGG